METLEEMSPEERAELFEYWFQGGDVEFYCQHHDRWTLGEPLWVPSFAYRKALTKPSINWDHVSDEYNWLAVDEDGKAFLHNKKPEQDSYGWYAVGGKYRLADSFSSYKPGTCDWKDSLVQRPDKQG
jgi:hypothetical protein